MSQIPRLMADRSHVCAPYGPVFSDRAWTANIARFKFLVPVAVEFVRDWDTSANTSVSLVAYGGQPPSS
ncbi:hypothetical protein [Streptomyces sp. NPDC096311]|uniref:hypothetical protein n=1 Tax=Streptomyces sp. NPDC096311 TaxID=3366083 RepID=UPI003828B08B